MRRKVIDILASVGSLAVVAAAGALLVGTGAYAATNWITRSNVDPSARSPSATASNLVVSAVVSPVATNVLYPGGIADVVVTISNLNSYPVTITAVRLPTNETYATGYTTSTLTTTQTGCLAATPSDVVWNYATASAGSSHTLTTALAVAAIGQANNPLTVTFTNDASMTAEVPAACENTYFSMPALTGVTATSGAASVTKSPATDRWTS